MDVLIIEDDFVTIEILKNHLSKSGHCGKIGTVVTLEEALEELSAKRYDVILLDLGLPDAQGMDAIVRLDTMYPDIPIVVNTSTNDTKTASCALEMGAQDFLVKGEIQHSRMILRILEYAVRRKKIKDDLETKVQERTRELNTAVEALHQLAKAQTWILQNDIDESELFWLLKKFGPMVDAERGYVFKKSKDKYNLLCKWYNDLTEPCDITAVPLLDDKGKPYIWHQSVITNKPFVAYVPDLTKSSRVFLEGVGIQSALFVPINNDSGKPWGVLVFGVCCSFKKWSKLEVTIIQSLGSLMAWVQERIERGRRINILHKDADKLLNKMKTFARVETEK